MSFNLELVLQHCFSVTSYIMRYTQFKQWKCWSKCMKTA